jgi:hypothetical protein
MLAEAVSKEPTTSAVIVRFLGVRVLWLVVGICRLLLLSTRLGAPPRLVLLLLLLVSVVLFLFFLLQGCCKSGVLVCL